MLVSHIIAKVGIIESIENVKHTVTVKLIT